MFFKTLPAPTQQLFKKLGDDSAVRHFYLAGGSAAALHLGHRISVDLDFFTSQTFNTDSMISRLSDFGKVTVQQSGTDTFVGLVSKTQVSFFHYPYSVLETPAEYHGIRVASLLDIALMKITAISQRGKRRDFVDLYYICHSGYALDDLLKQMPRKFPTLNYPSYHLMRALVYFDDAENDPRLKMLKPYNWREIKSYFESQVAGLMA